MLGGWGGTDTLVGSVGQSSIDGSEFADRFVLSSGVVAGLGGDDTITMTPGGDFALVSPGAGNDTVVLVGISNLLLYDDAPGAVSGNLGSGTVHDGWGGVDTVLGVTRISLPAAGSDLTGGPADETFILRRGGDHRIDGANGQDTVEWSAARADVSFALLSDGWLETRNRANDDVVMLRNVEKLKLTDATLDPTQPFNYTGHDFYTSAPEPMPSLSSIYGTIPSDSTIVAMMMVPVDLDVDGRPEWVMELA